MRAGWEQAGFEGQKWYRRDFAAGPLSFCIDLWSIDEDDCEWAFSFNNGSRSSFVANSPVKAMTTVEAMLAGYLRAAAKICRNTAEE